MGRTCRNICLRYKAKSVPNSMRYEIGHKRCTFCGIFLSIEDARCICCRAVLRTKARSRKKNSEDSFETNLSVTERLKESF